MVHNISACRSLLLHNSPSGVSHTTRWTRRRRIIRWYVCAVQVPCMHRDGAFCPGSSLRSQSAHRAKPLSIMLWDHWPRHHSAEVEYQKERTKTPYSLDIDLITTQLSTAARRHVVNMFSYRPLWINPITPCCASPRRAALGTSHRSTGYFGQLLVYKKNPFRATFNVLRTPWQSQSRPRTD